MAVIQAGCMRETSYQVFLDAQQHGKGARREGQSRQRRRRNEGHTHITCLSTLHSPGRHHTHTHTSHTRGSILSPVNLHELYTSYLTGCPRTYMEDE